MSKFTTENQPDRKHPPFSSTNQPANRGRRPKLKSIPPGARAKIIEALWHALSLPDQATAADYLRRTAKDLPEYGYMIQIYAKGMMGKNGIAYVADLLDRILGKPKQTTDVNLGSAQGTAVQISVGSQEAADALKKVLATGAQPRDPETPEDS